MSRQHVALPLLPFFAPLAFLACGAGHKDPPADPAVADHAGHATTEDLPAVGAGGESSAGAGGGTAGCAPSGPILYKQTSTPLRNPEAGPAWTFLVYEGGHWSVDGVGTEQDATGCLAAADLAALQDQLRTAQIEASPLGPDEVRCMAMPMAEVAVEVGAQRAAWKNPCGDARPSATLSALMDALAGDTYTRDAP